MPHVTRPTIEGQHSGLADPAGPRTFRAIAEAAGPDAARARSLYIHVPFCFHKCHYCDFYSIVDTRDRQDAYVDRLERELEAIAPLSAWPLETIFVGGGTPTLLRPDLWRRLAEALDRHFDLSAIRGRLSSTEFTVECNPETATPELMAELAGAGVTRLSLGAQSFDPRHLRTLERHHDPDNVPRALDLARRAGIERHSVDLIYAIPGQTLADWKADLRTALALGVEHLSAYNLTYEPRTAMTARLARGEFEPVEEDLEIEMFLAAASHTRAAGLERYEVSNAARPGRASAHNLAYWRQEPWLAAGPSASGHFAGHRWKNTARLDAYLALDDGGFAPIEDHEQPDARRAIAERLMTGLRLSEGVDARRLLGDLRAIDHTAIDRLQSVVGGYAESGHVHTHALQHGRWRVTEMGVLIADRIAADCMEAVL